MPYIIVTPSGIECDGSPMSPEAFAALLQSPDAPKEVCFGGNGWTAQMSDLAIAVNRRGRIVCALTSEAIDMMNVLFTGAAPSHNQEAISY